MYFFRDGELSGSHIVVINKDWCNYSESIWKLSTLWSIGWFLNGLCLYLQTINGSNYYVSTLTHDGWMENVGLTVRSLRLLALLCTHVKSTLPCDVWKVLNVCTVKMIDINKIKKNGIYSTIQIHGERMTWKRDIKKATTRSFSSGELLGYLLIGAHICTLSDTG